METKKIKTKKIETKTKTKTIELDFAPSDKVKVKWGTRKCQGTTKSTGKKCDNGAYWEVQENRETENSIMYLCAKCSNPMKDRRIELKRESKKEKRQRQLESRAAVDIDVDRYQAKNQEHKLRGNLVLTRFLGTRKQPVQKKGYLMVFPNFKDQNRVEGFGCASLSPKFPGLVEHGQPGLPAAKCVENFHQGIKFLAKEAEPEDKGTRIPGGTARPAKTFEASRLSMFLDDEPHRHKSEKGDICISQVWIDKKGTVHCLDRVQARQFYCTFYSRQVKERADFKTLIDNMDSGINMQLIGYDAYPCEKLKGLDTNDEKNYDKIVEAIYKTYNSPFVTFGHEWVLYTMLLIRDQSKWPWIVYKTFDY